MSGLGEEAKRVCTNQEQQETAQPKWLRSGSRGEAKGRKQGTPARVTL